MIDVGISIFFEILDQGLGCRVPILLYEGWNELRSVSHSSCNFHSTIRGRVSTIGTGTCCTNCRIPQKTHRVFFFFAGLGRCVKSGAQCFQASESGVTLQDALKPAHACARHVKLVFFKVSSLRIIKLHEADLAISQGLPSPLSACFHTPNSQ